MSAIETELKLIVDGDESFRRLVESTPNRLDTLEQLNLYLDTPRREIHAAGAAFRLRISGSGAWATVKRRSTGQTPGVYVSMEIEDELPLEMAICWLEEKGPLPLSGGVDFGDLDPLCSGDLLEVVTWSRTRRTRFRLSDDLVMEADETLFGDGTRDYELEIEHSDIDHARRAATGVARRAGIRLVGQVRTKHARALRHSGDGAWPVPVPDGRNGSC